MLQHKDILHFINIFCRPNSSVLKSLLIIWVLSILLNDLKAVAPIHYAMLKFLIQHILHVLADPQTLELKDVHCFELLTVHFFLII